MKMSRKLINLVEFCIMSIAEMEFVALSDTLLNLLAREDPDLKKKHFDVCFQPTSYLPFLIGEYLVMLTLSTKTQLENQANIG